MEAPQVGRWHKCHRCSQHNHHTQKQNLKLIHTEKEEERQGSNEMVDLNVEDEEAHLKHLFIFATQTEAEMAAPTTAKTKTKTRTRSEKISLKRCRHSLTLTALTLTASLLLTLDRFVLELEAQGQYQQHNNILHFVVPEGAPNNTYVGNIRSSDGQPPYLVLPAPQTPESERIAALTVNLANGDLHTNSILDRETRDQYHFVAIVKEPFAEIKCTVTVKDVNDNSPMFLLPNSSEGSYVIDIPEGQRGVRKVLPLAIDFDTPQFGIKEFRIVSGNTPSGTFQLVEHEAPARSALQNNLLLGADDQSISSASMGDDNPQLQQQFAQQATVLLPSQPQAMQSQLTSVAASTATGGSSAGSSASSGPATPTTTIITTTSSQASVAQSKFLIDLEVNQVLDRENQSSYQLVVEAIDGGQPPNFGKLMVTVNVQDINDNEPVFTRKSYEVHFREDTAKGSLLLRVQAHDADLEANAQISYFIKRHSSSSQPATSSSSSTSSNLNSNPNNSNSSDNSEVLASSTSSNSNGNRYSSSNKRQAASNSQQQQQQSTTTSVGSSGKIAQSQRTAGQQQQGNEIYDSEATFGKSTKVHSSGQQQEQLFEIDPAKGEIYLAHQLDYETDQVHELVIEARDHGKPSRSGYTLVKVFVIDVNDEPQPAAMSRLQMSEMDRIKQQMLLQQQQSSSMASSQAQGPSSEASRRFNGDLLGSTSGGEPATSGQQSFNLLAWFAQINPSSLFVIVLFVFFLVAFSVCFVKSGISHGGNLNKGGTMNSVGTHHSSAVRPSGSPLPATPNTTHSSGLPGGALHDGSHLAGGHHHHHQHGILGAGTMGTINSLGSLGTNNLGSGGGGHHHQHPQHHQHHLSPLLPSLPPLRSGSSNSGAGPNHHHQQANQLPPTPCNAPASVFAWPQSPAAVSCGAMGCFAPTPGACGGQHSSAACLGGSGVVGVHGGSVGGLHGGSHAGPLDHCGTLPSPVPASSQPLDRWFDLGALSQLVYAHDWYGSYNWDYLADWTPEYQSIMPLQGVRTNKIR